ncbi:hypothetical protein [Dethiosulfatarculus sandiegensis]|uniref:Uncharacterized protein n=1 Tax=Dethiosulfatarculus sandiegensis TaxID=1429043 RepID=A0A0D2HNC5_9BACT|nr:hypothetical protein [Dethiosulfatarculus sandiegensis]KIX12033.1 hypothetical protein X474_21265 [Dethiosulfatarculus sandiegensis]
MGEVQRLSGEGCAFFQRGRCTGTKGIKSPADAKCTLLDARRKVGARTLDRLERIKRLANAKDREVARRHVIQKNLEAISGITCPNFVPSSGAGSICWHQHLVYCLLKLPECQGRCIKYIRSAALSHSAQRSV